LATRSTPRVVSCCLTVGPLPQKGGGLDQTQIVMIYEKRAKSFESPYIRPKFLLLSIHQ